MSFRPALKLACGLLIMGATTPASAQRSPGWGSFNQRERVFMQHVMSGDEVKADEYARVAGINPNAVAGAPLSVWFYRLGAYGNAPLYDVKVQRIVFEKFRQDPNPKNVGQNRLSYFCANAPYSRTLQIQAGGMRTGAQAFGPKWEAVQRAIAEEQRPEIEAMASRFKSLIGYGLRDKALIRPIFVGCLGRRNFSLTKELYNLLVTPMIRAGMDINMPLEDGRPAIENFVRTMDYIMVDRLMTDGARLDITVRGLGCSRPTNLYVYFMNNLRPTNVTAALSVIKMLSRAGVSPMKPIAYGGYQCKFRSLYDAAIDAGNLRYAELIKAMAESGEQQRHASAATPPAPRPAAQQAQPAPPRTAAATAAPQPPPQIGQWRFIIKDGRPTAMARAVTHQGDQLAGLNLECVSGGRLEYVPVALKLFDPIRTLWINSAGDVFTFPLTNGRASRSTAVAISKQLLAEEAAYIRQGSADKWTLEMSIDSDNGPMSQIQLGGFSKIRSYMLANCKN
jgi:hypothetical protein